jgi:hypothetical protein
VPFLQFTRDRRGYENTYLRHLVRRRGKTRPVILYWFRSPPNVRVGRTALDEAAMRAIEDTHPDLEFNWQALLASQVALSSEIRQDWRRPQKPRRPAEEPLGRPGRGAVPAAPPPEPVEERPGSEQPAEPPPESIEPASAIGEVPPAPEAGEAATSRRTRRSRRGGRRRRRPGAAPAAEAAGDSGVETLEGPDQGSEPSSEEQG